MKQLEPNAEDRRAMEAVRRGGVGATSGIVGKRVRKKIHDAARQIRALAKGRCAGVLVLWEPFGVASYLDAYSVKTAMFGFDTLVLDVPSDYALRPVLVDSMSGKGRRMTRNQGTSISAVAVLDEREGGLGLRVYHNHHAAIPLPLDVLRLEQVTQFRLGESRPGQFDVWQDVDLG